MAKSRVEKNKKLYDELETDLFELEDISEVKKKKVEEDAFELEDISENKKEKITKPVKVEEKKQEIVPLNEPKKNDVAVVKQKKKVEAVSEDDFVVEQPISYTDKLSVEEILRARLEKQQQLKDKKKGYKKTPIAPNYTPEMMQKNVKQNVGVDVRKEVNIKVRKDNSNSIVILLVFLLILVAIAGAVLIYIIW